MSDYPPPPNPPGGYEQQPGYPPPGGGYPPPAQGAYGAPKNGMGTASLVLGIVSLLLCPPLGILALIFGFMGRGRAKRGEATNGGVALAGIITGALGTLAMIALTVLIIVGIVEFGDEFDNFTDCLESAEDDGTITDAERQDCEDQFEDDLGGN